MTSFRAVGESRTGRRSNNEDAWRVDTGLGLYTVADGMGGYEEGEVASRMAVEVIRDFLARNAEDGELTWPYKVDDELTFGENVVRVAIRLADDAITARGQRRQTKSGTTVVAVVERGDEAVFAHVGDSRIYRLRDGELDLLTRDHSFENQLRDLNGDWNAAELAECRRHVVTRALGVGAERDAEPDLERRDIDPGDRYLLCTDGVHDVLDIETLRELTAEPELNEVPHRILDAAYAAESTDNMTAVVLEAEP